ncbi:hypothetical protein SAMN05444161_9189 [Rhizobiales bacterium GAS191]|nr:hypothetical protein SAMN05444161_9189 [Rhizobiales bacterium GAS191]
MSEQRDDAHRRRAADRALLFEDEQIPTVAADGVESCSVFGNDVHVLYYQNQPGLRGRRVADAAQAHSVFDHQG